MRTISSPETGTIPKKRTSAKVSRGSWIAGFSESAAASLVPPRRGLRHLQGELHCHRPEEGRVPLERRAPHPAAGEHAEDGRFGIDADLAARSDVAVLHDPERTRGEVQHRQDQRLEVRLG